MLSFAIAWGHTLLLKFAHLQGGLHDFLQLQFVHSGRNGDIHVLVTDISRKSWDWMTFILSTPKEAKKKKTKQTNKTMWKEM
jgi:hypothetical protein